MKLSEFVAANGRLITKAAGAHLFRQGDQDTSLYIVKHGLLKAYYLSEDGKENIKTFISEGGKIGSLVAGYRQESCTFSLVCMENCELLLLTFADLQEASRTDLELSTEVVEFLLNFGIRKELREFELLCLTAEERYRRLLIEMPKLFDRVTQNEIARYLGVTPVGLSRIKTRVNFENGPDL